MKFSDFIHEANILPHLSGQTKVDVIKELLDHMHKLGVVSNYETALNDILVRENHLSTGLENGIAIPYSNAIIARRKTLGLPEIKTAPIDEIKALMKETKFEKNCSTNTVF